MKNLILLLSLPMLFIANNLNGSHNLTQFELEIEDKIPVTVTFGNQYYGPSTSFHIQAHPGRHFLKIERIRSGHYGKISQTLYQGHVVINPHTQIHAFLNRFMNLTIKEKQYHHVPNWGVVQSNCYHNYPGNYDYGHYPHEVIYEPVVMPMNNASFNAFIMTVKNQWFDSTRREVAKQVLADNYITTQQAKRLVSLFNFESSKVEIAKFAFHSVVDPENYYLIYNEFTFSSSVSELSGYIAMN